MFIISRCVKEEKRVTGGRSTLGLSQKNRNLYSPSHTPVPPQMAAPVPQNLGPHCRAVVVTPRPHSTPKLQCTPRSEHTPKTQESPELKGTPKPNGTPKLQGTPLTSAGHHSARDSGWSSRQSDCTSSVGSVCNKALTGVQVERAVSHRVQEKQGELRAAFRALDPEGSLSITKGEFRRVIEGFVMPLTQPQFTTVLAKAPKKENGRVAYMEFLRRYCRTPTTRSRNTQRLMSLGEIQRCLKDKIGNNLKNVTRAFRLFDYNRDGKIQKHELLRVLESYCLPLTNQEFQRIWFHYSPDNSATMSYREFLQRLDVDCKNHRKFEENQDSVKSALNWEAVNQDNKRQRQRTQAAAASIAVVPISQGLTLDQIHATFLKKIRSHYAEVWQALQAFDVTCSGFLSQEDLKSVLCQFIFPMSDFIFQDLASRFGLRASEPVPWAQFMAQFEDLPQVDVEASPVRDRDLNQKNLQILQEVYPLLKSSCLFDQGSTGKITRAELRRVTEGWKFRLTERQFKDLMILLDPEHAGIILSQRFQELLHPPAASVAENGKCNGDTQEPPQNERPATETCAWSTVEGLLQDKLSEHLDAVTEALKLYDSCQNGTVHQNELREVIQRYGLPVSDSHFHRLCEPCMDSGRVNYSRFLNSLGVTKRNDGTFSTTRALRQTRRSAVHRIKILAVEDTVLRKLRDDLTLRNIAINDCLLATGGNSGGMLSIKHLRKMLEDSGIALSLGDFSMLTEALCFRDGALPHADFLAKYEEKLKQERSMSVNSCLKEKQRNLLTAEDCLSQMKQRIQKHHGDILTAFLLMDKNRDGVINRGDFRILFDSLEFTSNEEEYQRILGMLGLEPGATLNYAEFFDAIQATGKPGIQLLSANKWKRFVEEAGEQVHSHLASRARSGWSEMAKSFSRFNEEGQGLVTKRDLKQLLYTYALPISPNQFEKLWSRYDREGRGELTHSEFLEQLGVVPEENGRGQSHMTMEGCSGSQTQGRAGSAGSQTAQTSPVQQEIREVVRRSYAEISCSLVGLDESKDGYVRLDDLQALLQKHGSQVKEDDLVHFLNSLKISVADRKLSYLHFLQAFGHRAASAPGSRPLRESVEQLSPDRAMLRLRQEVSASYHALHKVFSAFDKSGRGAVSPLEFRRVLDHFCVRLSDRQLTHLLSMLPVNEDDHSVPWRHFLLKFRIKDQTQSTENWLERVERAVGPSKPCPLPMSDILERIQEVVSAKLYTVAKDMAELDYGRINVISKEHFRVICDRHFLRVTDEQFESLWELLPVNEFGNLEYRELLKRFSGDSWRGPQTSEKGDPVTSPVCPEVSTSAIRRPKTAPCIIGRPKSANQAEETGRASVTGGGASPPLSADAVERRVRGQTRGCWKELQRRCREEDPAGCGGITTDSFLAILQDLQVKLSRADLQRLAAKHGIAVNGRIAYPEFLQQIVLSLQPRPLTAFHRPKVPPPRTPMKVGVLSGPCADSMLRLLDPVQRFWRPMRQSFIAFDRNRSGLISFRDFTQVLQTFSITLTQDDVFHLSSYFDKNLSGMISYNGFLQSLLQ